MARLQRAESKSNALSFDSGLCPPLMMTIPMTTALGKFGELTRSFENFGEHLCGEFAGIGVLH